MLCDWNLWMKTLQFLVLLLEISNYHYESDKGKNLWYKEFK
jgi:hypothetical protein